jgi:S-methylmethionine-dependent homocysteine/selenocysteine methylase
MVSVRQLHREFLRAGADVMQAFTFTKQDDPVEINGKLISVKSAKRSSSQDTLVQ